MDTMHRLLIMIPLFFILLGSGLAKAQTAGAPAYRIGTEDELDISVWKEPDLQRKVIVRPDGRISFPLVGEMEAAGRTLNDLQDTITARLTKYIPNPVVTILVDKLAGYKIYVLGQVKTSGEFTVGHFLDVMQALALAGGLTAFAEENNIKILRRENGRQTAILFEYAKVKEGEKLGQNIMLKSGDVVVVP
jgi:polysaccharide export outer membrane protein